MKPFLITAFLFIAAMPSFAQQLNDPVHVVQRQLDYYNVQNVEKFAEQFAPDVEVFNRIGDTVPSLRGRAELTARYADLFKKYPQNYSTLTGRIINGDYVIDHELLTGREQETQIVAIYEVKNGLITRCWFIR